MTDTDDPDTAALLAELTRTLRELETAIEPERRLRPPTPAELNRFTSDVAIPGLIFLLRTNIRALELLRRTLRLADGRDPQPEGTLTEARERAKQAGSATLTRLDDVLSQLQSNVERSDRNDRTTELIERAQQLREEIDAELDEAGSDPVDIDVDAELQAIKDDLDDEAGSDSAM